jgi:hypothetical protein
MSNPTDIQAPPEVTTRRWNDAQWQRERQAFHRLLPDLLKTHGGHFVAIHEEQVVDCDDDIVQLALRVYRKHGYLPIFFDLVTDQPLPPVRIPSVRDPANNIPASQIKLEML